MNHTNALDGLRGVAVLIVFLSHTSGRDYAVATWLDFAGIGHVGVYLFFVLSAFLLTHKIILQNDWRIYLLRRFWRIAPLYYVVVLATFFIQQLTGQVSERYLHVADGWDGLVKHLLFFKGNGVFWTIPTEFSFYFALPIIIWWLNRYGWTLAVIAAGISSFWYLAIRAGAPLPAIAIVDTVHQTTYFEVFLVGIAAALLPLPRWFTDQRVAILFWGLILITVVLVSQNILGLERPLYSIRFLTPLYGIIFALSVASAAGGNKHMHITAPWLVAVGRLGFPIYLLHMPVFQALHAVGAPAGLPGFIIAGAITFVISAIAHYTFEKPGIALGRKIERALLK